MANKAAAANKAAELWHRGWKDNGKLAGVVDATNLWLWIHRGSMGREGISCSWAHVRLRMGSRIVHFEAFGTGGRVQLIVR